MKELEMRWVALASILAVEACIVILLLQVLARWFWVWIRWPVWIVLVCAASIATIATCESTRGHSTISSGDWNSGQDLFNLQAPFPTYRLFLFSAVGGIPVLLFGFALTSLLRWKDGGLRLLAWRVSWRSSLMATAWSVGILVVVLVANDAWICHRISALDRESKLIAARTAPPPCSESDNAAGAYIEAGKLAVHPQDKTLPDWVENIELLRSEAWTEYFIRNASVAQTIRAASARPHCRFDIDWSSPDVIAENPEIGSVQDCLRLLNQEGRRALLDNDLDLGFSNAVALRRIAEQLNEDPRAYIQQLANVSEGAATNLIEHWLYLHKPTSDEVSQLVRPGFEFRQSLPAYAAWQQAEHYHMLAQLYFGLVADPDDRKIPGFRAMYAAILARNRLLSAGDDIHAVPLVCSEVKRRCEIPYGERITGNNQALWFYAYRCGGATVTKSMDPVVYSLIATHVRADMRRRLVDFALTIAERGLVDQILHDGPDNAVPSAERPIDLFDRKPVRIIVADGGVVCYSIDIHGGDDGGSEGVPASESGGRGFLQDMTFCLGEAYKTRRLTPPKKEPDEGPESNTDSPR